MPQIGDRIGDFEVLRVLGRGATATLYLARSSDRRLVVLKCLPGDATPAERRRLRREAAALQRLHHPNIQGLDRNAPCAPGCLALEYVEGQTLREWLNGRGPVPIDTAVAIGDQVAAGLEHAHDHHVQHHDLKPENVLLLPDGTAKLIDFGSGRRGGPRFPWGRSARASGTPDYAPPELGAGSRADARTDVYELGELLYELVTGTPPFGGDNAAAVLYQQLHAEPRPPHSLRADVPKGLEAIILKAMQKVPRNRYQQIADLRADLRRLSRQQDGGDDPIPHPQAEVHRDRGAERRSI